jgi:RNA polymerase-binding transcription factor DksA
MEIAARAEEMWRESARRKAEQDGRVETPEEFDGVHCVDCEDEIPPQRLRMGKARCVGCQTILERRRG